MTRTQIQQLVAVLLLILFVGVFLLSKKAPEPGSGVAPTPIPDGTAPVPPGQAEPPAAVPASAPDLSIPRDVFLLPKALLQRLQQREQGAIDLENQKKQLLSQTEVVPAQQIGITDLELQGIFWNVSNPQAIINRQIVSVGDRIDSAEVEAITKEGVILSLNGQRFNLKPETFRSSGDKKEGSSRSWSSDVNVR
jgi:hypothetical protein